MPIKSYLAYPARGRTADLTRALRQIAGCEVIPAENRPVLILVTDTADDAADEAVQVALAAIDSLQGLTLVSGLSDAALAGPASPPQTITQGEEPEHGSA